MLELEHHTRVTPNMIDDVGHQFADHEGGVIATVLNPPGAK